MTSEFKMKRNASLIAVSSETNAPKLVKKVTKTRQKHARTTVVDMSAPRAIARNTTVRCKHPSVMAYRHRRASSASRIVRRASSSSSSETSSSSEETPEQILRVSKRTSFEGLKASRRVELEKAVANGDDARVEKIEWAYDALIAESKAFFDERVAKDENAETRFQLGNFYQTLEKFEDAEREYRRSIELGTNVDACNNLAMILQERGELDEAEAFFLKGDLPRLAWTCQAQLLLVWGL